MKKLIEFPLENGKSIWVETEELSGRGYGAGDMSPRSVAENVVRTFENAMETTRDVAGKSD